MEEELDVLKEATVEVDVGAGTSDSPRKKIKMELTEDEKRKVKVPKHWREVYALLSKQRDEIITPVDTMGCEENGQEDRRADRGRTGPDGQPESDEEMARRLRFTTLVSLMLSSQTKDPVTADAVHKLQTRLPNGLCLASLLDTPDDVIQECIAKVGFFRRKTEYLRRAAEILRDRFGGDVPRTIDDLCSLPGVGPKMAFLQMQSMGLNVGIGVDTHVHRISNRLGWCKTKTPEQTRLALQSWLPVDVRARAPLTQLHRVINKQMVGFGQVICVPVGPRCEYVAASLTQPVRHWQGTPVPVVPQGRRKVAHKTCSYLLQGRHGRRGIRAHPRRQAGSHQCARQRGAENRGRGAGRPGVVACLSLIHI